MRVERQLAIDAKVSETMQDRDQIYAWFRFVGVVEGDDGWLPITAFIDYWKTHLTTQQGIGDLRWLVNHGLLERRMGICETGFRKGHPLAWYRARVYSDPDRPAIKGGP